MKKIPVTGAALQESIIGRAQGLGWHVAHFHTIRNFRGVYMTPAAADGKGWPDLVLVRDRLICAEVKGDNDRLKPEQIVWLEWLDEAGVESYVWKSSHWRSGEIDEILKRL